jgi:collagen type III alpha
LTDFGWTRLAYLLAVLSVLAAFVQLGSPSADPRPLASEPPEKRPAGEVASPAAGGPHQHEIGTPRAGDASREEQAAPPFARHLKKTIAAPPSASSDAGRAVFYRPPPARPAAAGPEPGSGERQGPDPVCGDLARIPSGNRLVFPLPMQHANSFGDTWGAPRPQGGHEGTDLMVPTGTPEYAITDGTIVPVTGSNGNGWNSLGGYAVMLRASYSAGPVREGDLFYYAHLDRESALPLGASVRAGQLVGYAGDTGQGPEVTRGLFPPHLHFGWYDATGTRSYLPSGAMNPYPLLEWLGAGGGVLGGGMDARYCEVPRGGAPKPSKGGDRWPAAREPGARPDLDTGTRRPAPTPAVGTTRPPARQAAQSGKATPAKAAPDRGPRASEPPASEPAGTGEVGGPPPRGAAPEGAPDQPAVEQGPMSGSSAPATPPEDRPAEEGSDPAPKEHDPGDGGRTGESDVPDGGTGGEDPKKPTAGKEEPEEEEPAEEEPEGAEDHPDEETTLDESETDEEPETDLDPEATPSGAGEDPEEPPQETTTEATTAE